MARRTWRDRLKKTRRGRIAAKPERIAAEHCAPDAHRHEEAKVNDSEHEPRQRGNECVRQAIEAALNRRVVSGQQPRERRESARDHGDCGGGSVRCAPPEQDSACTGDRRLESGTRAGRERHGEIVSPATDVRQRKSAASRTQIANERRSGLARDRGRPAGCADRLGITKQKEGEPKLALWKTGVQESIRSPGRRSRDKPLASAPRTFRWRGRSMNPWISSPHNRASSTGSSR